ncbi:MAG: PmoA family protein [Woeseiaceae bacterium]
MRSRGLAACIALGSLAFATVRADTTIATIRVDGLLDSPYEVPVDVSLDGITALPPERLALFRIDGGHAEAVPMQVSGSPRRMTWLAGPGDGGPAPVHYELRETAGGHSFEALNRNRADGLLTIAFASQPLLGYQYGFMPAPPGVDPAFGRSGFIHPLYSPRGRVLTRIQPPDHFHHYGIWDPWTHLEYDGAEYDLWNLGDKKGTVRFERFVSETSGPVYGEFTAEQQHVANTADGPTVIMDERQTIRVYRPEGDYYLFDMSIDLGAATDKPVTLLEYRYGGFGWRATAAWDKDNSEVLTSEGRDRRDADNTTGRWFYVQGAVDDGYAGAVVMSHPDNFNHPEPMRIWPIPDEGRGDVFASFSPTRDTDWRIEPGQRYVRVYRFLVYDGHMTAPGAESAWQNFAHKPGVTIEAPREE